MRKQNNKSRKVSWLLRHGALESNLPMDPAGWVLIQDLLSLLDMHQADLYNIVQSNNKSRYEVKNGKIRAAQGHSFSGTPVCQEALERSWTPYMSHDNCWHGTSMDVLDEIAKEGISAQQRTHVHLAKTPESRVGKRACVHVLLEVSTTKLWSRQYDVFESSNGVLLARYVPIDCIVGLRPVVKKARKRNVELQAMFSF